MAADRPRRRKRSNTESSPMKRKERAGATTLMRREIQPERNPTAVRMTPLTPKTPMEKESATIPAKEPMTAPAISPLTMAKRMTAIGKTFSPKREAASQAPGTASRRSNRHTRSALAACRKMFTQW